MTHASFWSILHLDSTHTPSDSFEYNSSKRVIQANLDMKDSLGPGELVRHMQNLSYTYDTYRITPHTTCTFIHHNTYVKEGVRVINGYINRTFLH